MENNKFKNHPVSNVIWVPIDMIQANNYNPNAVAKKEMQLLSLSIRSDGFTQPIVTVYDDKIEKYIIIDGFHRYFIAKNDKVVNELCCNMAPVVILKKGINERMASTIRHNRARGKHKVTGMSNMVFEMLKNGMRDSEICNELGMEPEEIIKLKHITGFSKLFENVEYGKSWESRDQVKLRIQYEKK